MKKRTPVSEIMTKNVITINTSDSLETTELLYKKNKIRHIPVVNGEEIIGMLSYSDILRISFVDAVDEEDDHVEAIVYNMFTVKQVMTKNIVTVNPDTTIKDAAKIIAANEFHALPVVEDKKLIGIVTTTDLINYLIQQF